MADQNPMQMQPLLAERAPTRSGLEEITPELIEMAAQYGYISADQKLQLLQHKQAAEMRKTEMPLTQDAGGGHLIAANPMAQAAAAIQQYRGGEQEQQALQAMQANNMRHQEIDKYGLQQDIARRRNDFSSLQDQEAQRSAQANEGITGPQEFLDGDYPGKGVSEADSPMHILSKPPASKPKLAPLPVIPGQTMTPNPNVFRPQPPVSPLFGWTDSLGVNRGGR